MPTPGSPVRASRLHSAISNSPRGIVTRDKSPSKQENEIEPYQTIPSWNSPEKLGQMRPDMRVSLPPKADGSPAAREAARRLAVSKERMPDEGLYAIINPILDTGEQLAETAGPIVQSGVNFLAEVVTSPFKGDPWKRTAEWKARKLREEALRVAQVRPPRQQNPACTCRCAIATAALHAKLQTSEPEDLENSTSCNHTSQCPAASPLPFCVPAAAPASPRFRLRAHRRSREKTS